AMKKCITSPAVVAAGNVERAWREVGASFERFCLNAGLATLASMMEEDARELCGPRYGRDRGKAGHRWGKTKGKVAFHGGKIEMERPRVRGRDGGELALPSWEVANSEDWLGRWALSQMLINVSTRKFGRSVRLHPRESRSRQSSGPPELRTASESAQLSRIPPPTTFGTQRTARRPADRFPPRASRPHHEWGRG